MKSRLLVSLGLLFALSCSRVSTPVSHTKQQIDAANNLITQYGLSQMPTYDELLSFPKVELKDAAGNDKRPWTDTYWATVNKNLARRWGPIRSNDEANIDSYADFRVGAYFKTQAEEIDTTNPTLSVNLAPAEKFDIAYRSLKKLNLANHNLDLLSLIKLDRDWKDTNDGTTQERSSAKRHLAKKYLEAIKGGFLVSHLKSALVSELSPLAMEGFTNYLDISSNASNNFPGEDTGGADWSWEGICHGWAPAAVMEDEPKHGVIVSVNVGHSNDKPKDLIFTEGDIRALLDKTWAQANNDEQFFIGRRCEKNLTEPSKGVPSNANGRAVGGSMNYIDENGRSRSGEFTVVQDYPRTSGKISLFRVVLESEWTNGAAKYAYLLQSGKNYALTYNEADAFAQAEGKAVAKPATMASGVDFYGCWDTNPASFHALLVENIGKNNIGFVMDRTQSAQVWNQPVGKAKFAIGALQDVNAIAASDVAHAYRAPGTAYVAEVTAVVSWSGEPSAPRFSYTQDGVDFDEQQFLSTTYQYTLEFDANKKLIGGEWGTLSSLKTHENPDFLFGFTKKVEPDLKNAPDYLRTGYPAIIKKIHDCSLSDKVDGSVQAPIKLGRQGVITQTISYSRCAL